MQQSLKDYYTGRQVNVRLRNNQIVVGDVTGRLTDFAHVTWEDQTAGRIGVEVAWETVVNCINSNRPVII